jgi:hypothetical protein
LGLLETCYFVTLFDEVGGGQFFAPGHLKTSYFVLKVTKLPALSFYLNCAVHHCTPGRNCPLYFSLHYSGRGKFMPLPLKSKILETSESLVTDDIKMFPL